MLELKLTMSFALGIYRSNSTNCNHPKKFFFRFFISSFFHLLQLNTMSKTAPCTFRPACFFSGHSATHRASVAISACLAGEKVRYDGTDKPSPAYPLLGTELNLISVCPEQGAGLGVPRPPVELVEKDVRISALGRNNRSLDVTAALQDFAAHSFTRLCGTHQLCGYLWKSRSPSCGFNSTPVFDAAGAETHRASGIQAAYFQRHLPHLSYCEETELQSDRAAISFILRCRLAFDVLYGTDAPLPELQRHYQFLHACLHECHIASAGTLAVIDNRSEYLAALLTGCREMPEEKLLGLFV